MAQVALAADARLAFDSVVLIYMFEGQEEYRRKLAPFLEAVSAARATAEASLLALAEILVKPIESDNRELVGLYRDLFVDSEGFIARPITIPVLEIAAFLRAQFRFRLPDSIHLASALEFGATDFVTNDARLKLFEQSKWSGRLRVWVVEELE